MSMQLVVGTGSRSTALADHGEEWRREELVGAWPARCSHGHLPITAGACKTQEKQRSRSTFSWQHAWLGALHCTKRTGMYRCDNSWLQAVTGSTTIADRCKHTRGSQYDH